MTRRNSAAGIGIGALLFMCGLPAPAMPEVNVNINIGPPAVVVAEPPEMIVVPHTMVYFAPDASVELLFHAGYWWTPNQGRWFRAQAYDGPWVVVEPRRVPVEIVRLPRDYRRAHVHHKRIPHGHLKKHYESRHRDRRHGRGEWKDRKEDRRGRDNGKKHRKGGYR